MGVDYAGPIYFKSNENIHKSYILLFTCCVRRVIIFEITVDLGEKSLLLALRKFVAKQGQSKLIISDSFTTF